MALKCDLCSKKTVAGGSHVHHRGVAGGQWKRRAQHTKRSIAPNLHWVTKSINGSLVRMKACANCIKRIRFDAKRAAAVAKA